MKLTPSNATRRSCQIPIGEVIASRARQRHPATRGRRGGVRERVEVGARRAQAPTSRRESADERRECPAGRSRRSRSRRNSLYSKDNTCYSFESFLMTREGLWSSGMIVALGSERNGVQCEIATSLGNAASPASSFRFPTGPVFFSFEHDALWRTRKNTKTNARVSKTQPKRVLQVCCVLHGCSSVSAYSVSR